MTNNYYMLDNFHTPCSYWITILLNHQLRVSLTKTVCIAEIHLTELWNSIAYHAAEDDSPDFFEFALNNNNAVTRRTFTLNLFRRLLDFPVHAEYYTLPSERDMLRAIHELGYVGNLEKLNDFRKKNLSKRWCVLYTIINRCFLPTKTGTDTMTRMMLQIFYSLVFNANVDYAAIIWENMKHHVLQNNKNYIPYIRFFSIIIEHFIAESEETDIPITRYPRQNLVYIPSIKYLQDKTGNTDAVSALLPAHFLALIPEDDTRINDYLREIEVPMDPEQPLQVQPLQDPTPGTLRIQGEGSSKRKGSKKRKESEGERIEGALEIEDTQDQLSQEIPIADLQVKRSRVETATEQHTMESGTEMEFYAEIDAIYDTITGGDKEGNEGVVENVREAERSGSETGQKENVSPSAPVGTLEHRSNTSTGETAVGETVCPTIEKVGGTDQPSHSTFASHSDSEELVSESVDLGFNRQKEFLNESSANRTLDAPEQDLGLGAQVARTDVEKLKSLEKTSQRSSGRPLRIKIKTVLNRGDNVVSGGETVATGAPSARFIENANISSSSLDVTARTDIETPKSPVEGASRRLSGNPDAINVQTVSSGGSLSLVHSTAATTEEPHDYMSDFRASVTTREDQLAIVSVSNQHELAGTNIDPTYYVERPELFGSPAGSSNPIAGHRVDPIDSILVSTDIFRDIRDFTSSGAQSEPAISSGISSQSQQLQQMPFDDIKTIFHARLMSRQVLTTYETGILALLNAELSLPSTPSSINFQAQLDALNDRVRKIEAQCRPSNVSLVRRHDDPDSEDQHEGEKGGHHTEQPNVSSAGTSHEETGISRGAGGNWDDVEDDFEIEPPLNIGSPMRPVCLIDFRNFDTINSQSDSEEFKVMNAIFSEEATPVTEEKLERLEREIIEVNSDDEDKFDENIFSYVKDEEVTEQMIENVKDKGKEKEGESSHAESEIDLEKDFDEQFNQDQFNNLETPNEEILEILKFDHLNNEDSTLLVKEKIRDDKFNKNRKERLDLSKEQERKILRAPFLEEQAYKIFNKEEMKTIDRFSVLGAYSFKTDNHMRTEYIMLMKRYRSKDREDIEEQKIYPIKSFKGIVCVGFHRIFIPEFTVFRENNKEYKFTEADFPDLPLKEVMHVYNYLHTATLKDINYQIALKSVKRYMREMIKLASLEDFQLGLESIRKKINLTLPNTTLFGNDLQEMPFCLVMTEPEEGFVFRNGKYNKIFIRTSELKKYSDGTLKLAQKHLRHQVCSENTSEDQKPLILNVLVKIRRQLVLRIRMRQYEMCHGFRKRRYFKGATYAPGFKYSGHHQPSAQPASEDFAPVKPFIADAEGNEMIEDLN